jgi:hypothetical protein
MTRYPKTDITGLNQRRPGGTPPGLLFYRMFPKKKPPGEPGGQFIDEVL